MAEFDDFGETAAQKALRRLRLGARDDSSQVIGYLDEQGDPQAWTGNDEAPYVIAVVRPSGSPTPGSALLKINSGATAVSNLVVKASPGVLYQVYFLNTNGNTRYLMVLDDTTNTNGAVPTVPAFPVCGGQFASLDFDPYGLPEYTGIVLGCSSTQLTYTAASDGVFTALYL